MESAMRCGATMLSPSDESWADLFREDHRMGNLSISISLTYETYGNEEKIIQWLNQYGTTEAWEDGCNWSTSACRRCWRMRRWLHPSRRKLMRPIGEHHQLKWFSMRHHEVLHGKVQSKIMDFQWQFIGFSMKNHGNTIIKHKSPINQPLMGSMISPGDEWPSMEEWVQAHQQRNELILAKEMRANQGWSALFMQWHGATHEHMVSKWKIISVMSKNELWWMIVRRQHHVMRL